MPTYLYCVLLPAGGDVPDPPPTGIAGAPVRGLRTGALTAWVETVSERVLTPSLDAVRVHDSVIQTALATGSTPLPVRFGQTFESDDDCRASLAEQHQRLIADLERVRDLVEMRLVIALRTEAAANADTGLESPGRAYMHRLVRDRSTEQAVESLANAVRGRLRAIVFPFVRDEAFVIGTSPRAVLTVSHLIARGDVASYRSALEGATHGTDVERLVICGPVAPYQFVSAPA